MNIEENNVDTIGLEYSASVKLEVYKSRQSVVVNPRCFFISGFLVCFALPFCEFVSALSLLYPSGTFFFNQASMTERGCKWLKFISLFKSSKIYSFGHLLGPVGTIPSRHVCLDSMSSWDDTKSADAHTSSSVRRDFRIYRLKSRVKTVRVRTLQSQIFADRSTVPAGSQSGHGNECVSRRRCCKVVAHCTIVRTCRLYTTLAVCLFGTLSRRVAQFGMIPNASSL